MTTSLSFRCAESDLERLARVCGPVPRSLVARAALLIGIELFERDPGAVMSLKPAKPGPKPKKKK